MYKKKKEPSNSITDLNQNFSKFEAVYQWASKLTRGRNGITDYYWTEPVKMSRKIYQSLRT
jgi:hypothetical protein